MMTVEVTTRDSDAPRLYAHVHETSFVINGSVFKIEAENETDYIPISAIKTISIVDENTNEDDIAL